MTDIEKHIKNLFNVEYTQDDYFKQAMAYVHKKYEVITLIQRNFKNKNWGFSWLINILPFNHQTQTFVWNWSKCRPLKGLELSDASTKMQQLYLDHVGSLLEPKGNTTDNILLISQGMAANNGKCYQENRISVLRHWKNVIWKRC